VGFGGVSQPLLPSYLFLYQGTALVAAGAAVENALHTFRKLHALNRADLLAARAGQHEAARLG
ncbi:MAG: hypothetical protein Q7T75_00090, partial [Mesorhizobium sp.]|nr:hypothetical protein [Mesorhizobium sp.]